jgi:hypothetical protein
MDQRADHRTITEPAAPPPPSISWYGYQTLAADATAVALAFVSAGKNSTPVAIGAIGIYLLGAPTVHALHGRPLATVGSLGLRIFLPLISSALGAATADCTNRVVNDEACDFAPRVVGFLVGMAAAAVIDGAAVAWEREAAPPPPPNRAAARAALSPTASLSFSPVLIRDGAGLSFAGLF